MPIICQNPCSQPQPVCLVVIVTVTEPTPAPKPPGKPTAHALKTLAVGSLFVGEAGAMIGSLYFLDDVSADIRLAVILIVGVGCLLLTLGTLAVVFKRLGLDDKHQALGLPEGSVRAVLALMLILLFFVSTIFFTSFLSVGEKTRSLKNVTPEQLALIPAGDIAEQKPAETTTSTTTTSSPTATTTAVGATGTVPVIPPVVVSDPVGLLFDVKLYEPISPDSRDLAKQAATAGSTLVAAIAAFYFGAASSRPPKPPTDAATKKSVPGPGPGGAPTDAVVSPTAPGGVSGSATPAAATALSDPPVEDGCGLAWSDVEDDSDLYLLSLAVDQGAAVPSAEPVVGDVFPPAQPPGGN